MTYTLSTSLDLDFDAAIDRVKSALSEQGFGVLTEIDLTATMADKLDVEMERYVILGACNPSLAHRALEADRHVGALLPCNVVVREDGGRVAVDALDPAIMGQVSAGGVLDEVAADARARIEAALATLS